MMTAMAATGAHAATASQSLTFNIQCFGDSVSPCRGADFLDFNAFDSTNGTLTDVRLSLSSAVFGGTDMIATIQHQMSVLDSMSGGGFFDYSFNDLDLDGTYGLASYIDTGLVTFGLFLSAGQTFFADWSGLNGGTMTLTYEYDENTTPPAVPLPASLGFLALVMAGLGFAAYRRNAR